MNVELRDDFSSLQELRTYFGDLRSMGDIFQVNPKTYVITDYQLIRNISETLIIFEPLILETGSDNCRK